MSSNSPFRNRGFVGNLLREVVRWARAKRIRLAQGSRVRFGTSFSIGKSADIRPPSFFYCGNCVGIGKNFTCESNAEIGDNVLISSNVSFISNDHAFDDRTSDIFHQGRLAPSSIIIEGDSLIGFGSILIAPCRIEKGAIVGAGSLVKGKIKADMIYAGVPARPIKPRFS
jgi:acetyltransferase-like isoleucine patch superfamily enzyme